MKRQGQVELVDGVVMRVAPVHTATPGVVRCVLEALLSRMMAHHKKHFGMKNKYLLQSGEEWTSTTQHSMSGLVGDDLIVLGV